MKKRIFSVLVAIAVFICAGLVCSSADAETAGDFRVAIIIDADDMEGFSEGEGVLRGFTEILNANPDIAVTFYFDTGNTERNKDFAATLLYFRVKNYLFGQYTGDAASASELGDYIKYVTKISERLVITDSPSTFAELGYSVITDFDIVISDIENPEIRADVQRDIKVKLTLSENTISEFQKLVDYAAANSVGIFGTNEKTE